MSENMSWTGLSPADIAANARSHPFADGLEPLMHKITLLALRESQRLTPVATGLLRRSETTRVEVGGLRGWVGSNVVYAPFVHYGTRFMSGTPFFEQGIAAAGPDIEKLLAESGDDYMAGLVKP
jgi:hypothetical protein